MALRILGSLAVLFALIASTNAPTSISAADPLTDLAAFVSAGRLDQELLDSMATNGSADGIVVIDDSAVIAQFAAQKASIGIASDSAAILSQKQATSTSMKSALLGRAPSGSTTVIQDYSHFATQFVHLSFVYVSAVAAHV